MNYTIEQLLSFAWQWVYPHDPVYLLRLFAIGYVAFFPAVALRRATEFLEVLVISVWIGVQAYFLNDAFYDPFNFPEGLFYYFLGTIPYFMAGVALARVTTDPIISLWMNLGAALMGPTKKSEDFSIINSVAVFALRIAMFLATLLITPIAYFKNPIWVRERYYSQSYQAFVQSVQAKRIKAQDANLERVFAALRKISTVFTYPIRSLALTILFVSAAGTVLAIYFSAYLSMTDVAKIIAKVHVDVVVFTLLAVVVTAFLAGVGWLESAQRPTFKRPVRWPRELTRASQKLVLVSGIIIIFNCVVATQAFPDDKKSYIAVLLSVFSIYVIALAIMIADSVHRGVRAYNLPAAAIACLSVSPVWGLLFFKIAPAVWFLPFFLAFALLASDYVFTKINGEHFAPYAYKFLHGWLLHYPSSNSRALTLSEVGLEIYSGSRPAGIQIKLKRSQRTNMFGTLFFVLDARMAVSKDDLSLIRKYRLQKTIVYDSKSRQRYEEAARGHLESSREHPAATADTEAQFLGVAKTIFRLSRATVSTAIAALTLRITVMSLLRGIHVECKSMNELLEGENAIVTAARNLKMYLETAATFDGREEILEL